MCRLCNYNYIDHCKYSRDSHSKCFSWLCKECEAWALLFEAFLCIMASGKCVLNYNYFVIIPCFVRKNSGKQGFKQNDKPPSLLMSFGIYASTLITFHIAENFCPCGKAVGTLWLQWLYWILTSNYFWNERTFSNY